MKQSILFIRRAVFALFMMMLTSTVAWAEEVTEEQAQQQALEFLISRRPTSKVRRASGTMPQFTTIRQISGLYVKDGYSGNNETAVEAKAVATLMQYCGYSLRMNYGSSSGSWPVPVQNLRRRRATRHGFLKLLTYNSRALLLVSIVSTVHLPMNLQMASLFRTIKSSSRNNKNLAPCLRI